MSVRTPVIASTSPRMLVLQCLQYQRGAAVVICARVSTEGSISHITSGSAGLQKWRKNLQLLVPFLIDPGIELFSLSELDALASSNNSAQKLKVSCIADLDAHITSYTHR